MLKMKKRKICVAPLVLGVLGASIVAFFLFSDRGSPTDQAQKYYEHGLALVKQHEYAKAAIELRNSLRLQNDKLAAWRALADIDEATQQWDNLLKTLQSIVSLDPSDIDARIKLIKLLTLSGRVYQALELVDNNLDGDKQDARILWAEGGDTL